MGEVKTRAFTAGRGYSEEDWDEVSDNPEWTEEDFRNAKPFAEVFPEWAKAVELEQRENEAAVAASAGRKALVTLALDVEVLEKFQADGDDWKERINEALRKALF